jgi:hypothetical protein
MLAFSAGARYRINVAILHWAGLIFYFWLRVFTAPGVDHQHGDRSKRETAPQATGESFDFYASEICFFASAHR